MVPSVVFMFSGQGSQYYGMANKLYQGHPVFKKVADELDDIALDIIGESIVKLIYSKDYDYKDEFKRTIFTHPAIYIVEYALAQTLIAEGVIPAFTVGSSLGEFASAALAGVMNVEELLEAVLMQAKTIEGHCRNGGMLAIFHEVSLLNDVPAFFDSVDLVSTNYGAHFVISGSCDSLERVSDFLTKKNILFQSLAVSHAFHSYLIDPASTMYKAFLDRKKSSSPKIPFVSSLTGTILANVHSHHFWDIVRKPVLFREAIIELEKGGPRMYLDLGPGGVMANFIKRNLSHDSRSEHHAIITPYHHEFKFLQTIERFKNRETKTRKGKNMIAYIFPGQGSQQKGMGGELFDEFPEITTKADKILGYSIKTLCLEDPYKQMGQTKFTQPALYVVNALCYSKKVKETGMRPDYVAGHSLGEYSALFAAGAFDFETGLKLVMKRGELMSLAAGGGMAAVMAVDAGIVDEILRQNNLGSIDIANLNAPSQTVIAGPKEEILRIAPLFENAGAMYIPLNVSGAFHSRYMEPSQREFEVFVNQFTFSALEMPVVSNVSARPYGKDVKKNLVGQITQSVKWSETIRYLMGKGVTEFEEVGPGTVLTSLVQTIRRQAEPLIVLEEDSLPKTPAALTETAPEQEVQPATSGVVSPDKPQASQREVSKTEINGSSAAAVDAPHSGCSNGSPSSGAVPSAPGSVSPYSLGNREFRQDYNLRYAYLAGSMYRGISSKEMVVALGKAGMMGFWGSGGMGTRDLEEAIKYIQGALTAGEPYGVNLLHNPNDSSREEKKVEVLLRYGVNTIEASAYLSITPALVKYRAHGLRRNRDGSISGTNKIIAKISRPEIAEAFLSPAPQRIVEKLVQENQISRERAELLREIPVANDLCAEADSGGHTDGATAYALIPAIMKLRDDLMEKYGYRKQIRIGAAGGIGTPEAAAAALIMGADFIMTGSINQCTVEASTSDAVKDMLQNINVQDTDYAPAGDMFELGAKVQVMKRGVFFPARANKLFEMYRKYSSVEEIDEKTKKMLEEKYFKRSFEDIYAEMILSLSPVDKVRLEAIPKQKLALIFKWYFAYSTRIALEGVPGHEVDYQVQCGPALGAFNQWIKGTPLEDWRNRRVDQIGEKLMHETADLLNRRFKAFVNC
jgi:trans-AT polyketide synthase, acyltransferase and oxidoreductase domains